MKAPDVDRLTVLTGAGVSAESGVPTFRGAGGLWDKHRAEELATPEMFRRDPGLVWRFYAERRRLVAECKPNPAHTSLAEMERAFGDFTLITQNVDGLHSEAGSQDVIELHGSLWRLRCTGCEHRWSDHSNPLVSLPPLCPECGQLARPDVVWFGEVLDPAIVQNAMNAVSRASLMLIIGTSAIVHPAATLPLLAKDAGAFLIEINTMVTPLSQMVDQRIEGKAGEELPRLWENLRKFRT